MSNYRELTIAIELWGTVFSTIGLACSFLMSRAEERQDTRYNNHYMAMFAMVLLACAGDALAGVYRGLTDSFAWVATRFGNYATFFGNFFLLAAYTSCVCTRIEGANHQGYLTWRRSVWGAAAFMSVLAALGTFYTIDEYNLYQRTDYFWLTYLYSLVVGLVDAALVIINRKHLSLGDFVFLISCIFAPLVAMGIQLFVYGLNFLVISEVVLSMLLFLEDQAHSANLLIEKNEELARTQLEVSESRIAVMVTQIQPHFLFNTLDSIYYLCGVDPNRAQEAVDRFSTYLRSNLNSLNQLEPVPVEAELEHVKTYLQLEQLSMEDLITWRIDAQATGFKVPALSLQTLAENAVKHGIGKRPGGGTIVIRTYETPDGWLATVRDDGMGFDVTAPIPEGHVGLTNTRLRLASMCNGTLFIESKPNVGTMATIHIPK